MTTINEALELIARIARRTEKQNAQLLVVSHYLKQATDLLVDAGLMTCEPIREQAQTIDKVSILAHSILKAAKHINENGESYGQSIQ
jgi:aspartokinase